jgi:hypothetical protein
MYVLYYASMLRCCHLVWILVRTDHPLLSDDMSQLVSELYEYNTTLTAIFLKTYSEDMLQCLYKDYSRIDMWQANRDLLSAIYFLQRRTYAKVRR